MVILASVALLAVVSPASGTNDPRDKWAVFAPEIATGSPSSLTKIFNIEPTSIYFVRSGSQRGRQIPLKGVWQLQEVAASGEGLIAATVLFNATTEAERHKANFAVMVLDTLGSEIATIRGGRVCRWSPDGRKLAVWFSRSDDELPYSDSVSVWDSANRTSRTWRVQCTAAGWLTPTVLVLNRPEKSHVVDLTAGQITSSTRIGTIPSPDTTYALYYNYERGPEIWDEAHRTDLTDKVVALLEGGDLRFTSWPFWVRGSGGGHLLCFNSCRYFNSRQNPTSGPPECFTWVVDVATLTVVRKIHGQGIGPTADQQGVVVLRGRELQFIALAE